MDLKDFQIGGRYRIQVEHGHWETYEGTVVGHSYGWWDSAPQNDVRLIVLDTGAGMTELVSIALDEIDSAQTLD